MKLRKIFIVPWFGEYPDYMNQWIANMEYLKPLGYDYLLVCSLNKFEQRVREKLGIEPHILSGTGKAWDYRPALGILFEDEIKGYDYWGHTDFDCVYGKIDEFMPDHELVKLDIWSNHHCYCSGPWTLYKNNKYINNLFKNCPDWKERMSEYKATGWIEDGYSKMIDKLHDENKLVRKYTFFQGYDPNIDINLTFKDGHLYDQDKEIMQFHYNRRKRFPLKEEEL